MPQPAVEQRIDGIAGGTPAQALSAGAVRRRIVGGSPPARGRDMIGGL
jgi:hypothetical protein